MINFTSFFLHLIKTVFSEELLNLEEKKDER